jgi:4-aminobutyrate aminotransferase/(S)-3-amino-2-methylpropionate transaminase
MLNTARTNVELLAMRDRNIPRGVVTAHPVVAARAEGPISGM